MSSQPSSLTSTSPGFEAAGTDTDVADLKDLLEACLGDLVRRGPLDDLAELAAMLPPTNAPTRKFVLIELIKLEMALSAENGKLRQIDQYVAALGGLLHTESIPVDLVMEEIQLRKEHGEVPSREEFEARFPQFASVLMDVVGDLEATLALNNVGVVANQPVGRQLDDFLIIQELGRGAFAQVYLARQVSMRRLVALKVSQGKGDESQALAQFDHPNVVRVFDQRAIVDQDLHLLYMQFLPGGTLADAVKLVSETDVNRRGEVLLESVDRNLLKTAQVVPERSSVRDWIASAPWAAVVAWIGVQLARALADSHSRGVLHRDVKPANVLLSAEAIPKLADFNVSHAGAAGRAGASVSFGGSIAYMAPEHLRAIDAHVMAPSPDVQEPADLYSLAITLWELWQGRRPFDCEAASSWSEAVQQQSRARKLPLVEPMRVGSASERVLEKTLRSALSYSIEQRPKNGAELAGRLRLALHPDAASLFDPDEGTFRWHLARMSPWFVAGFAILLPNVAAGIFNFEYNEHQTGLTSEMKVGLYRLAFWVNSIFYPLGVVLLIWFARRMVRAVRMASEGKAISSNDLDDTLALGQRAAVIGGTLWLIAGIIYPVSLLAMFPDFTPGHAIHFFTSLLICGGVAMIYPYFGLAIASTLAYYPKLLGGSMQDDQFDERAKKIVGRADIYLLGSAIIPLLGAALLVSSEGSSRIVMLIAIAAGVVGLLASFFAHRVIAENWARMGEVLSKQTSVVPGEGSGD